MSKTELVDFIAKETGLTKVAAAGALKATLEGITDGLKKDGKVVLIGFGTFAVKERTARKGINPLTKKTLNIPAKKIASFKAGAALKTAVK
ncbi:MAG: HU family DNA-binding protein [Spirochaetia bacterium]|nr:HU family DNA-binding protein [Spirochaetia bacterium]